jgi:hypothetical protein
MLTPTIEGTTKKRPSGIRNDALPCSWLVPYAIIAMINDPI